MGADRFARAFALVIAAIAWIGLGIHVDAQWRLSGSLLTALWVIGAYFTVLANLFVAIAFTLLALRGPRGINARLLAGITISIALVGVVYALLLSGLEELTAGAAVANILLHQLTPILVPIFWVLCAPKGALRREDPVLWLSFPAIYLAYALVRGTAEGHFAYPFLNYVTQGVVPVAITLLVIALAFLATGWLMVLLDRRLAR